MKTRETPSPDALVNELQAIVSAHLPALLTESAEMSKHLDALGTVRQDVVLKARLSLSGEPIERASIAVSAFATGDLNEERARTLVEHAIRGLKKEPQPEDPGQAVLGL